MDDETNGNGELRLCVHCGNVMRKVYSRNLCHSCYVEVDIRNAHPILVPGYNNHGLGLKAPEKGRIGEPTDALPGSDEKKRVLAERAASGLPLWHPKDAGMSDDKSGTLD